IIGGAASGALYTATTSMVADITTRQERTKYMGLVGMCIGFGFIFGPGVGGLLAGISLSFAYYMTTIVIAIALVFSFFKVPETFKRPTNKVPKNITMTIDYFMQPIGILLVGTFFVMFFMSGMESTFQLLGQDRINITPTELGVLFFMLVGQLMSVVAFIMLHFMTGLVYAGICIVLLMTGNALAKTLMTSLITKGASEHDMGRVTATSYSLDSLGRIFGPLVFNALFLI